jgi:predicted GNAT superfamily acetyltransferase
VPPVPAASVPAALVAEAAAAARTVADRYGLRVVELAEVAAHGAVVDLFCRVWNAASPDDMVNISLLRALSHSGNYVTGAYLGDRLVGAAVAFFGTDHLHSHITGVDRAVQAGGVGFALKQHQRGWTLRRGLTRVCWTFDPLVRRNAHFNLTKLGATATEYLPDFYGPLTDGINAGDASDRLYVDWRLDSERAIGAARGDPRPLIPEKAQVLLDCVDDEPIASAADDGGPLLVAVPPDIEGLRRRDPARGARWRAAVRQAITTAFTQGYRISGMTADGRYVLEP